MKIVEKKEVQYYKSKDDKCPYIEWRSTLDMKTQAILASRISRLELGNLGFVENLGEGVHELKIDFGPGLRIYFGNMHGSLVIILAGGPKGTQSEDIAAAKLYWKDWKARYGASYAK